MDLKKELSDIKDILKNNPRGMTVMEIARAMKMNRHSVAKYMDMLVIAGHVELKTFGSSKVFFLARRVPMSAILNFSSDFIVILNKDLEIINVNDRFLEFEGVQREDLLNKSVVNSSFPMEFTPSIIPNIKEALGGIESSIEAFLLKGDDEYYFSVKFVPTVFDDTEKGVTIIFEDITARKQAEEALKESEQRFRAIYEQAAVGIAYVGMDGHIHNPNPRFTEIVGYTRDELKDMTYKDLIHSDDIKLNDNFLSRMLSGAIDVYTMEKRCIRKDGKPIWVHITVSCVRDQDGLIKYLIPVIEDNSAHKAAEEALKESEQRFRGIFEHAAVGIAYLAGDARFIQMNARFAEILGYPMERLLKMSYRDITHPDDLKSSIENVERLSRGKIESFSMEKRYIRADGTTVWGHLTESCIRNPDGSIKYFIPVIEDITARKLAEDVLRRTREELESRVQARTADLKKANDALLAEISRTKAMEKEIMKAYHMMNDIIEKAPYGVYVVDEEGRIEYVNPAMLKISGDGDTEFKAMNVFELPPYKTIGLDGLIKDALRGQYFYLGPVEYTSHFGKKASVRNFIGIPMEEGGKKKVLVFVEDFAKYKLLEEALLNKR